MIDRLFRTLPSFKGKQRLARFLLHNEVNSGKESIVLGKNGCLYKLPNTLENVGFEILINGIYEPDTIKFITNSLKKNSLFIDVGANIGAITVPVSKLRKDVEVVSVEAAPWLFNYLEWNVSSNQLGKIKVVNRALSNSIGTWVDFFSPKDKFGKGSLSPVFTHNAVRVKTTTLDELANELDRKIDFIKVDVEGFESLIFEGGSKLLNGDLAPDILFEFVDWAEELAGEKPGNAQVRLLDFGYDLYLFQKGIKGKRLKTPIYRGAAMIFATKSK